MKITILGLISLVLMRQGFSQTPKLGKNSINEIIAAFTLEEKANLLVGNGFSIPGITPPAGPVIGQANDRVAGAAGTTFAIPRLGIPSIVLSDGPAGVRIDPFRNGDSTRSTDWFGGKDAVAQMKARWL